jgi:hypothetical protein
MMMTVLMTMATMMLMLMLVVMVMVMMWPHAEPPHHRAVGSCHINSFGTFCKSISFGL